MLVGEAVTVNTGGLTLTCTESVNAYAPMTVVAFIHPDREIVRVQVFSFQAHEALIPPVPLSGRQVQPDRFQPPGGDGVTDAVKVTAWGP